MRVGDALYDPYIDTPLVMPNISPMTADELKAELDKAVGRVALMVFHGIDDPKMPSIPFKELVKKIADCGGKCITFRELSEYIDHVKAYNYTHQKP